MHCKSIGYNPALHPPKLERESTQNIVHPSLKKKGLETVCCSMSWDQSSGKVLTDIKLEKYVEASDPTIPYVHSLRIAGMVVSAPNLQGPHDAPSK